MQISFAQVKTISGTVSDVSGVLPGVSVIIEGTKTGTETDFDGNYTIKIDNRNNSLVFSFTGFKKQIIPIGLKNSINVTLVTDISQLDEVVVVGYGTQARKDVTGAITKICLLYTSDAADE